MYAKCRLNGLHVRKEGVCLVLKELNPAGVLMRRARCLRRRSYFSRGPNFIWHLDSYDKLKPFGICINGCIDRFSRKMTWLNAYTTSSDPKLIGGYDIEAVQHLGGCPRAVRGDLGTENVHVRDFQRVLRINPPDETLDSYLEEASTANQRIKMYKKVLKINYNLNVPSGQPNVMYSLPELYGTRDFLAPVENDYLEQYKNECVFCQPIRCDADVYALCNVVMAECHLNLPRDPYQAIDLYLQLREISGSL
ncbi:hypothetical protein LDENG_00234950 [Lucifuga dentata]|nr:hypothetical protein LDENG_00234950 [Lucifuga dentata]